jgi:hypothetical protein
MFDIHDHVVPEMTMLLTAMTGYFDKAVHHAQAKNYDVNALLTARLAPDQYALAKQVAATCYVAEECVARLAGKGATAKWDDVDTTFAGLRSRVEKTISRLKSFKKDEFKGWEERPCDIFWLSGKCLPGMTYFMQVGYPNFFFHLTSVYAILRHNGVEVGKMDFLGPVAFQDKKN